MAIIRVLKEYMISKAMVDLFLENMESPETKKDYADAIKRFIVWSGIKKELRRTSSTIIQGKLIM
jgi:hypothetical protein